jgi:hypothetical protein
MPTLTSWTRHARSLLVNASTQQAASGASGAPRPQGTSPPRRCTHEERALLVPYACSSCTDEEALGFEAHLLLCAQCFEDLKTLDRAGVLIREFADSKSAGLERLLAERRQAARKDTQRDT